LTLVLGVDDAVGVDVTTTMGGCVGTGVCVGLGVEVGVNVSVGGTGVLVVVGLGVLVGVGVGVGATAQPHSVTSAKTHARIKDAVIQIERPLTRESLMPVSPHICSAQKGNENGSVSNFKWIIA
jgi:hypothetical protein